MPQKKSFGQKMFFNFMHWFKSAILAIFPYCKIQLMLLIQLMLPGSVYLDAISRLISYHFSPNLIRVGRLLDTTV